MFKVKDYYYKKAKTEKFLARSVYKLEEIDKKYKIIKSKDRVLDLGYYPGSWVQYTSKIVGEEGVVVGVDIQDISVKLSQPKHVRLFQMDIFNIKGPGDLHETELFNVVLSDMAPSTTGIKSVDQDRSLNLVEAVFELLPKILKPGGHFVIKVFESQKARDFLKLQKKHFGSLNYLKPKSTRSISKEFFVIGKDFSHN